MFKRAHFHDVCFDNVFWLYIPTLKFNACLFVGMAEMNYFLLLLLFISMAKISCLFLIIYFDCYKSLPLQLLSHQSLTSTTPSSCSGMCVCVDFLTSVLGFFLCLLDVNVFLAICEYQVKSMSINFYLQTLNPAKSIYL